MTTLKNLIAYQELTGETDEQIICRYFIENNLEEQGMELSNKLAKSKIDKMKHREMIIKEWCYNIPSQYLYETYDLTTASMLHRIELDYIVNGEVTEHRLKWASENLPYIKLPSTYFYPCIDWLAKQGIMFDDDGKYYSKKW